MSSESHAHGTFVHVDGVRLYRETWGRADAPVLLCLHGLGGGTHFFAALGAALADQCRTVAIDLPGSGLSPPLNAASSPSSPAPTSPAFSFDSVSALVVSLARAERANSGGAVALLGHSMGTILALEAIRRGHHPHPDPLPGGEGTMFPDLISRLMVVGGLPEPLAGARTRIRDRVQQVRQRSIAGMGTDVVAANFSRASQDARPELTALFAKLFDRQDPEAYAVTAEALAAWTARELPPLDDVSCLVITGDEDRYAPPDAIHAFARTLPPSTRVEIMPRCGHLPFLEQPAAFADIVAQFLRQA